MVELFQHDKLTPSEQIRNIFKEKSNSEKGSSPEIQDNCR
jgi:hypothetical protein